MVDQFPLTGKRAITRSFSLSSENGREAGLSCAPLCDCAVILVGTGAGVRAREMRSLWLPSPSPSGSLGMNHGRDHSSCAGKSHIMSGEWVKGRAPATSPGPPAVEMTSELPP